MQLSAMFLTYAPICNSTTKKLISHTIKRAKKDYVSYIIGIFAGTCLIWESKFHQFPLYVFWKRLWSFGEIRFINVNKFFIAVARVCLEWIEFMCVFEFEEIYCTLMCVPFVYYCLGDKNMLQTYIVQCTHIMINRKAEDEWEDFYKIVP